MGVGGTKVLVDAQLPGRHRRTSYERSAHADQASKSKADGNDRRCRHSVIASPQRSRCPARGIRRKLGILRRTRDGLSDYFRLIHRALRARGVPISYAPVKAFTMATGVRPSVVVYYSGWHEPFQVGFARTAANEGAVPLVQMNPTRTNVAAIAAGRYDGYLSTYAKAVRSYHRPVILSFGHEMNGYWYSWGYTHTSPAVFVAAWRHIVNAIPGAESPECERGCGQ